MITPLFSDDYACRLDMRSFLPNQPLLMVGAIAADVVPEPMPLHIAKL